MNFKRKVISANLGGISNRIKCLISLQRLQKEHNRKIFLYWPLNHTCGAKFSDLFKNRIDEIDTKDITEILNKDSKRLNENSLTIEESREKFLITGTWKFILKKSELVKNPFLEKRRESNENGIDLNFSDVPEEIKKDILNYLKFLKPIKWINEEIEKFDKKYNLNKMIGVHIRRGDFADRKVSPGRVSSDDKFIERIKVLLKENSNTQFFLCTDSKDIEDKMKRIFGNKIIMYPKTNFSRTDVRATQEGLIDLILLSKTKHIIGTYRSTFTEMAWWMGNCKPKIEIIVDHEKEKEYLINTKKENKRIIPKLKRLILRLFKETSFKKMINGLAS